MFDKKKYFEDTIIIDDIPVCFDDMGRKQLEQLILSINCNYKIEYFPVYFGEEPTYTTHKLINDYQLLAYI